MDKTGERHATDATSREAGRNEAVAFEAQAETDAGPAALVTAAQLAARWHVPVRTIHAWARRTAIPHYRVGRLLRFDPDEVEQHFRRHGFVDEVAAIFISALDADSRGRLRPNVQADRESVQELLGGLVAPK